MKNSVEETSSPQPTKRKYYIDYTPLNPTATTSQDDFDKLKKSDKDKHKLANDSIKVLLSWPNSDIWPFKLALPASGLCAGIPGFVLNAAFRNTLLLGHYGRVSSYLAVSGIPAITASLLHYVVITSDILEQKTPCPVCVQIRSAALQGIVGMLYPIVLAPIVSFPIATAMKNLYFPKFHKQPKEVLGYAVDIFKSVRSRYLALGALQIISGMGIAYLEQKCYFDTLLPVLQEGNDSFNKETRKINFYQ